MSRPTHRVRRVPGRLLVVLLGLSATLPGLACDSSEECTEIACEHEAVVTIPSGLVQGPYDLTLTFEGGMSVVARCADPSAPETAQNPEDITCDASGFTIAGERANARDVRVTIAEPDDGEVLAQGIEVRLDAVGEETPNGPGCPPTCFVRNGQLQLGQPE